MYLTSTYVNDLKFKSQCFWPQYTGQVLILLLFLLWFQSYAPKLTNGKLFFFLNLTLVSLCQMFWDFYTICLTIHRPSWLTFHLWFQSYVPVYVRWKWGICVPWTHSSIYKTAWGIDNTFYMESVSQNVTITIPSRVMPLFVLWISKKKKKTDDNLWTKSQIEAKCGM